MVITVARGCGVLVSGALGEEGTDEILPEGLFLFFECFHLSYRSIEARLKGSSSGEWLGCVLVAVAALDLLENVTET